MKRPIGMARKVSSRRFVYLAHGVEHLRRAPLMRHSCASQTGNNRNQPDNIWLAAADSALQCGMGQIREIPVLERMGYT